MIVYNIDDLNPCGKIGLWSIGRHIHDGHRHLYQITKHKCDYIIGLYFHNWSLQIKEICGVHNHQYYATERSDTLDQTVLNEMQDKCNVVMVYTGRYTSFENPQEIKREIERQLPLHDFDDIGLVSLRTSQAIKYVFNKKVKYDYHNGGLKDPWRKKYAEWHTKYYPEIEYELIDSILDEHGNSLDCCSPEMTETLLLPEMKTIEDVKEHIKDKNIKVVYFEIDDKTINARFQYGNDKNNWWHAGVKR